MCHMVYLSLLASNDLGIPNVAQYKYIKLLCQSPWKYELTTLETLGLANYGCVTHLVYSFEKVFLMNIPKDIMLMVVVAEIMLVNCKFDFTSLPMKLISPFFPEQYRN